MVTHVRCAFWQSDASLAVGLASFSEGQIPAAALAMYLTLEACVYWRRIAGNPLRRHHGRRCFAGAGKPADARDAFSGGFLAGEIKTSRKERNSFIDALPYGSGKRP